MKKKRTFFYCPRRHKCGIIKGYDTLSCQVIMITKGTKNKLTARTVCSAVGISFEHLTEGTIIELA